MKEKHIAEIRAFNRFYTKVIGLLDKHILDSQYTLPEVRILFELANHEQLTATDIISNLGIDKGYLSRMLLSFEKKKLVQRKRSGEDGRSVYLALTTSGQKEFDLLNKASDKQLREILAHLSVKECDTLVQRMNEIKTILSKIDATS